MANNVSMRNWLLLISVLTAADQISKYFAISKLELAQSIALIPNLNMTLVYNEGAAFGFLGDAGGWQRWLFSLIAVGVTGYLIFWLRSLDQSQKRLALAISLIVSGALGNLIDRIVQAKVTDFVDFYYSSSSHCIPFFYPLSDYMGGYNCHWPSFNLADICISLGAIILLLDVFLESSSDEKSTD
ncbi:MAG: signal peptidase II [Gammaproteobacteria bacterium]|jgi:signal peptidase II|nr:signal peptidase II [Gammaproteobacteria bacterium]